MNNYLIENQTMLFTFNTYYDAYFWQAYPQIFELEEGKEYHILWDGVEYIETAEIMSSGALSGIGIGNKMFIGGENTGEPFIISYIPNETANDAFSTDTEQTTHVVSIYTVETSNKSIVLYDRTGAAVTYENVETITTDTPVEGEKATFTRGIPIENIPIVPDFTSGNQEVVAPGGYLVRGATIVKPDTLAPENIKKNVEIAGVVGNFAGDMREKTVELDMVAGDQVIEADEDTVLTKVTVTKPETLVPENILMNKNIGGVVGTLNDGTQPVIPVEIPDNWDDVIFFDMYGNTVLRVPLAEVSELESMPTPPVYDGFTFQSWNYTLDEVRALTRPADIGAHYITSDGKTRIRVKIAPLGTTWYPGTSGFQWYQSKSNGVKISIDGAADITVSRTGNVSITGKTFSSSKPSYNLTFTPDDDCTFYWRGCTSYKASNRTITPMTDTIAVGVNYQFKFSDSDSTVLNVPEDSITEIVSGIYLTRIKNLVLPRTFTNYSYSFTFPNMDGCVSFPATLVSTSLTTLSLNIYTPRYIAPNIDFTNCRFTAHLNSKVQYVIMPEICGQFSISYGYCVQKIVLPQVGELLSLRYMYSLKEITIPQSIIPRFDLDQIFDTCYSLTKIHWEGEYENIAASSEYIYYNCTSLKTITFPKGVTSISSSSLNYGNYPQIIIYPEGCTTIEQGLGSSAYGLNLVVFPSTVTTVYGSIIIESGPIQAVVCQSPQPPTNLSTIVTRLYSYHPNAYLYVPDEYLDTYLAAFVGEESSIKPLSEFPGGFDVNKYL